MVEIAPEHWPLLPEIPPGADSRNLDEAQEAALTEAGYIVGPLQRVIFGDPGVKDTNWSATAAVEGPDGVSRRWVYLHYFKEGQPSLNWLDPTFAAARLVVGDALHSIGVLGASALRLDANGFLGVEKGRPVGRRGPRVIRFRSPRTSSSRAWSASLGGFTFQSSTSPSTTSARWGRPAPTCPMTSSTVRHTTMRWRRGTPPSRGSPSPSPSARGVDGSLIHALQNHDEVTYELVHFADLHRDDLFDFRGEQVRGADLAVRIRGELIDTLTGTAGPYNAIFTTNGISSTTASVVCAALGLRDLDALTDADVAAVRRAHLLLAGVQRAPAGGLRALRLGPHRHAAVSRESVAPLLADGDTRWIHRGGYDLLGHAPDALASAGGMPRALALRDAPGPARRPDSSSPGYATSSRCATGSAWRPDGRSMSRMSTTRRARHGPRPVRRRGDDGHGAQRRSGSGHHGSCARLTCPSVPRSVTSSPVCRWCRRRGRLGVGAPRRLRHGLSGGLRSAEVYSAALTMARTRSTTRRSAASTDGLNPSRATTTPADRDDIQPLPVGRWPSRCRPGATVRRGCRRRPC